MKTRLISIFVVTILLTMLASCAGLGEVFSKDPIQVYHYLIVDYQNGQMAAANGNTCLSLNFAEITAHSTLFNSYLTSNVEKAKVWRQALATYGKQFSDAQGKYVGADGKPLQPDQLDLDQLAKQGATPAQMGLTIQAYVTSFTEAPLENIPVEALTNTQRLVSEKFNMSFMCIKDWNTAINQYNIDRNKIPGDAIGSLAKALGKELPASLPYFVMTAPVAPPAIPTYAPVK